MSGDNNGVNSFKFGGSRRLNLTGTNDIKEWKLWVQHFKIWLPVHNFEKEDDKRKFALLLAALGTNDKIIEIFNSFNREIVTYHKVY